MVGQLPLGPEFFAAGDDADTENLLPAAIGDDTSRERVVLIHQPLCDGQPIPRYSRRQRRKRHGRPFRNGLAHVEEIAAVLNLGDAPLALGQLAHDRHGDRL